MIHSYRDKGDFNIVYIPSDNRDIYIFAIKNMETALIHDPAKDKKDVLCTFNTTSLCISAYTILVKNTIFI